MRGFLSRFLDNGLEISGIGKNTCLVENCHMPSMSGGVTVRGCDCAYSSCTGG